MTDPSPALLRKCALPFCHMPAAEGSDYCEHHAGLYQDFWESGNDDD